MTYTDFIAVIDLGTSHIVGMVGKKNENGVLSIIAYDNTEKSDGCIRRGCVYNVEETANKINRVVLKLENKMDGAKIAKIYIGVGGKSIRTLDHTVSKILGAEGEVTPAVLQELDKECRNYHPAMLDILDITSPVYLLDGKEENEPLGISCSRIEAHYKLIVGQPAIRRTILTNIAERIKLQVAGVLVSPLALAELVLTPTDKQGAVLIDFGAGVTSVTIYKNGRLKALTVVPLGANLITRDIIKGLNVPESEAERLKRTFGSALPLDREKGQQKIDINKTGDYRMQEITLSELNEIVEARSREIVENAYARLEDANVAKAAGFKAVIAGSGAALNNLREAVSQRFNMEVHYPSVRKGAVDGNVEMIANNPEITTAVALLLQGHENCAYKPEPKPEPKKPIIPEEPKIIPEEPVPGPYQEVEPNSKKQENKAKEERQKTETAEKENWFKKWKKKIDTTAGDLFNDNNL